MYKDHTGRAPDAVLFAYDAMHAMLRNPGIAQRFYYGSSKVYNMHTLLTVLLDVSHIDVCDAMEVVGENQRFLGPLDVEPMSYHTAKLAHEDIKSRVTLRMRHLMRGCYMLYNRELYQRGFGPSVVLLAYGITEGPGSVLV